MNHDFTIAAYYFPNFHPDPRNEAIHGSGWTEWELIREAVPRFKGHRQPKRPLWGWENEADPEVMARKIDAAADHGLDAWFFDYYNYEDGPFLNGCLDRGFLRAPNRRRMKFALMWANHDWLRIHGHDPRRGMPACDCSGAVSPKRFGEICDEIVERYFRQPEYLLLDGCPFFSIYEIGTLAAGFRTPEEMRAALDEFRAKVKRAGFRDLHLNLIHCGLPNLPGARQPENWNEIISAAEADSAGCYTWIHHGGLDRFPCSGYVKCREDYLAVWERLSAELSVPYFPNVTIGWDNTPRLCHETPFEGRYSTPVLIGNTPEAFQEALQLTRSRLEADPSLPRLITVNAWNEWPESSALEPDETYGFGYLEALKNVFGKP